MTGPERGNKEEGHWKLVRTLSVGLERKRNSRDG